MIVWFCPKCLSMNKRKNEKCASCGEPMPDYVAKSRKGVSPAFTILVIITVILLIALFYVYNLTNSYKPTKPKTNASSTSTTEKIDSPKIPSSARAAGVTSIKHGEMLSFYESDDSVVIKVKITSSYSNKATIDQNYFNVEDFIKNQGCDKYDEIQYWAVADLSGGSEGKVVSFTVPSKTISKIKNGQIAATQIGDNVDDLYILPSLLE